MADQFCPSDGGAIYIDDKKDQRCIMCGTIIKGLNGLVKPPYNNSGSIPISMLIKHGIDDPTEPSLAKKCKKCGINIKYHLFDIEKSMKSIKYCKCGQVFN